MAPNMPIQNHLFPDNISDLPVIINELHAVLNEQRVAMNDLRIIMNELRVSVNELRVSVNELSAAVNSLTLKIESVIQEVTETEKALDKCVQQNLNADTENIKNVILDAWKKGHEFIKKLNQRYGKATDMEPQPSTND